MRRTTNCGYPYDEVEQVWPRDGLGHRISTMHDADTNFRELRLGEVRRIPLLQRWVNKGEKKGRKSVIILRPFDACIRRLRGLPRAGRPSVHQLRASTSRQKASTRALNSSGTSWKGWCASPGSLFVRSAD